jgi:small GTP-binding protein
VIYKIIITGPVGSGKTTAVNSLTDKEAMLTDVTVSDSDHATKQRKRTTTVAMDYDVIRLKNNDIVHVYGTPGQERFDFMWDILSKGANGMILLMDNSRNYPFRDLKYYTKRFANIIESVPLVIAVTRFDLNQDPPLEAYRQWLTKLGIKADVIAVDARERADVTNLFFNLLAISDAEKDTAVTTAITASKTAVIPVSTALDVELNKVTEAKSKVEVKREKEPIPEALATPVKEEAEPKLEYAAEEHIQLNEAMLPEVAKVAGVTGVTLSTSMGELLNSTIDDEELNEFFAFLSGVNTEIENALNRGKIHRIMLRSPQDDNLTLFVEHDKSLGVSSERVKSIQALSQQIEDMLQWM